MILEKLAEASRYRVEKRKVRKSPELLRREAESMGRETGFPFEAALRKPDLSWERSGLIRLFKPRFHKETGQEN